MVTWGTQKSCTVTEKTRLDVEFSIREVENRVPQVRTWPCQRRAARFRPRFRPPATPGGRAVFGALFALCRVLGLFCYWVLHTRVVDDFSFLGQTSPGDCVPKDGVYRV